MDAAERQALFAEIERVARERGWYDETASRQRRVINEAWVVVPLVIGFASGTALDLVAGGADIPLVSLGNLRELATEWSLANSMYAAAIVAAIIGWFVSQIRARVVELEEVLVTHVPAIALERSMDRRFPFLPLRPTVVLEHASGEQIAYGAELSCYSGLSRFGPGLAFIADRRLLAFQPLDAA